MRLKPHIIAVANTATLRQIVDDYELIVDDKRKRQALADAISSARCCQTEDLLGYLAESEVKQACASVGIDARGRKNALIARLLEAVTPAPAVTPKENRLLNRMQQTCNWVHPMHLLMSRNTDLSRLKATRCSTGAVSARLPQRSIIRRS